MALSSSTTLYSDPVENDFSGSVRLERKDAHFGKYLGAGQHCRVFRGEYHDQSIALKVRHTRQTEFTASSHNDGNASKCLDDEQAMAVERQLIAEAKILSRLPKHPHIVGYIGIIADDDPGGPVLVLEHVSRHSAAELFTADVRRRAQHSWVRLELQRRATGASPCATILLALPFPRLAG